MEGEIAQERPNELDSLLEASNDPVVAETSQVTQPDDLEEREETRETKPRKKAAPRKPGISAVSKRGKTNMAKTPKKSGPMNGDTKTGIAVTEDTKKLVRKLRAKMELESGERVSISQAIASAVENALE
jgi:hypothetical protein